MLREGDTSEERQNDIRTITLSEHQVLRLEESLLEAIKDRSALKKTSKPIPIEDSENSKVSFITIDDDSEANIQQDWIAMISNIVAGIRKGKQIMLHTVSTPINTVVANIKFSDNDHLSYDLTSTQLQQLLHILFSDEELEDYTETQTPNQAIENILQTLQTEQPVLFSL